MSENETQDRKECFLQELKDLLKKYRPELCSAEEYSFDAICAYILYTIDKLSSFVRK